MRKFGHIILALVVLLSAVPTATIATSAASGPSGFVGIPDGNIDADVPEGESPPIPSSELRGKVLASNHADTLQVTVTTADRAATNLGANGSVVGHQDVAFVLEDNENHEGRDIALPSKAVHDALGFTPARVSGVHSSGSEWSSKVRNVEGYLVFYVPEFSQNTVTFTGTVEINGNPASDGASYSYDVSDVDAVDNFVVNVTGATSTEWDNESFVGTDGTSSSVSIAGSTDPRGPSTNDEPVVEFTGVESTSSFTASGIGFSDGQTKNVVVDGNQQPDNASVTFTGTRSMNTRMVSGTGATSSTTDSVSVNGNLAPENQQVTFTGRESTSSGSLSATDLADGETTDVSVSGDANPRNAEVTFEGVESSGSSLSDSSTGVAAGQSDSLSISGDADPTGPASGSPQLTLTGHEVQQSLGSSAIGETVSVSTNNPPTYVETVYVEIRNKDSSDGQSADIVISVDGQEVKRVDTPGNVQEGDRYYDFISLGVVAESSVTVTVESHGFEDFQIDSANIRTGAPKSVTATASDGTSVSFGDFTDGETKSKAFPVGVDASSLTIDSQNNSESFDWTLEYTERIGSHNPSLDVDNDGTPDASYSGSLAPGETATTSVDSGALSAGSSTVRTGTDDGTKTSWSLSYDEVHHTTNPGLNVGNDGSVDASHSGVLAPGETATVSVSGLSTGSNSLGFAVDGPAPTDYEIAFDEVTGTKNPGVDVTGDGTLDAQHIGVLDEGETATKSLVGLSTGTNTVEVSTDTEPVDWEIAATEVSHTDDPALDINGDGSYEVSHVGTLSPGETASYEASSVSTLTDTVMLSTNAGSAEVDIQLQEVTQTEDVTIEVNGQTTSYPTTLSDGETVSLTTDASWIREGTNRVNVTVSSGGGEAPPAAVGLEYRHDSMDDQTVEYDAEVWTERYNVSKTFAEGLSSTSLTIPFQGSVMDIRRIERQTSNNTWESVGSSNYALDGTTLTVDLGEVDAGETATVRAVGSKARVNNGSIRVTDPTVSGQRLDSLIEVESWSDDSYILVPNQTQFGLIHYAYQESWVSSSDYALVKANGNQRLYLPKAVEGSTARVTTLPVAAEPATGDVRVSVPNSVSNSEPTFSVSSGNSRQDDVQFTFVEARSGEDYVLWSETYGIQKDSGSGSPTVTLTDDDSAETLKIKTDGNATSTSTSNNFGLPTGPLPENSGSALNSIPVVLVAAVLLIVGLFVLFRRFGWLSVGATGWLPVSPAFAGAVGLIGFVVIDYVSGRVFTQAIGSGLAQVTPLAGIIGTLLAAYWFYRRFILGAPQ